MSSERRSETGICCTISYCSLSRCPRSARISRSEAAFSNDTKPLARTALSLRCIGNHARSLMVPLNFGRVSVSGVPKRELPGHGRDQSKKSSQQNSRHGLRVVRRFWPWGVVGFVPWVGTGAAMLKLVSTLGADRDFKQAALRLRRNDTLKLHVEYWQKAPLTKPRGANAIGINYHNPHFLNWPNRI